MVNSVFCERRVFRYFLNTKQNKITNLLRDNRHCIFQIAMTHNVQEILNKKHLWCGSEAEKVEPEKIPICIKECTKDLNNLVKTLVNEKSESEREIIADAICSLQAYRTRLKQIRALRVELALQTMAKGGTDVTEEVEQVEGTATASSSSWAPSTEAIAELKPPPSTATIQPNIKWEEVASAFGCRVRTAVLINLAHKEPNDFLSECGEVICMELEAILRKQFAVKINATLSAEFKTMMDYDEVYEFKSMNTKTSTLYEITTKLSDWFTEHLKSPILTMLEEFQERQSGWALSRMVHLVLNINQFTPQLGSSYIPLPEEIRSKKACINVKNKDNACFAWSVISALYIEPIHSYLISCYPHYASILNLTNLTFPMKLLDIPKFEALNSISINVYRLKKVREDDQDTFKTVPCYLTKHKLEKHVNLLMIQNVYHYEDEADGEDEDEDDDSQTLYHYVWIKNLSRLVSAQLSKQSAQRYICERCLRYFEKEDVLENHIEYCKELNSCKIRMPRKRDSILKFKNRKNRLNVPFVIYCDLKCILTNDKHEKTKVYEDHVPISIAYYVKCSYDPTLSFYRAYRGEDCVEWFTRELGQFAEDVETVFQCPLPTDVLTDEEKSNFKKATECHICKNLFSRNDKVEDYCPLTGKYRGPAHELCKMDYEDSRVVPVVFHNLSEHETNIVIKSFATNLEGPVNFSPTKKQGYISFTKHLSESLIKFRFIDSFLFLSSSLDTLASDLRRFPHLRQEFEGLSDRQFNLLKRQGVYPYGYLDNSEKFLETALPDRSQFSDKWCDSVISQSDYNHACTVWSEFGIINLSVYSVLCMKTDVLLLTDVFEEFRLNCFRAYGLDPAHYSSLPDYAWDAMLKYTGVTLDLLTDVDKFMFFEKGIRGGLCQCSKKYSRANHKYSPGYDPSQETKYLFHGDINNLYGWAMTQSLPHGTFRWKNSYDKFDVNTIASDSETGYILEVDLEYPSELHDAHSDLPFCPEHFCAPKSREPKLIATLHDKSRYVLHYRNLQQALKHGLKLLKIHKILRFDQSFWLKSFIDLNTRLKASAKNELANLYELMTNAVFDKTMEDDRMLSTVKLTTKWEGRNGAESLINKPEFKSSAIFGENLIGIELNQTDVLLKRPVYVGMCVLELAKTRLYEFHYDYMLPEFGANCSLCYTDTDSLIYQVECPDLYEVIKKDCHTHFDTSDYSPHNVLGIPLVNKKVLGLVSDRNKGRIMCEFVGLRSKMYAVRINNVKEEVKEYKSAKSYITKTKITFNDYAASLNEGIEEEATPNSIQSKEETANSFTQRKIALGLYDDKRCGSKSSFETLPWGHANI